MPRRPRRSTPAAPPAEPTEPVEIFRAGTQALMVRFVQALLVLIATPGLLWAAWALLTIPDPSLSPAARYALVAGVLAFAAATSLGMVVYGWCYVMSATWDPRAGACHLKLAGLFIPIRLTITDAEGGRYHAGQSHVSPIEVNAPWYSIRVPGRRLPLILDLQGEFLHPELVDRVLLARAKSA
jgi:hypothetical protein